MPNLQSVACSVQSSNQSARRGHNGPPFLKKRTLHRPRLALRWPGVVRRWRAVSDRYGIRSLVHYDINVRAVIMIATDSHAVCMLLSFVCLCLPILPKKLLCNFTAMSDSHSLAILFYFALLVPKFLVYYLGTINRSGVRFLLGSDSVA